MDNRLRHLKTGPALRKPLGARSSSSFVGRSGEMGRLSAALAHAAEGLGSTILLAGEPGIGKTRLAHEVLILAEQRGFTALEGRAFSFQTGLAYGPFLDAFGPLLHNLDAVQLTALVSELPSLGRLFEGDRLPPVEPLGDPALEKTRLFEALSCLLERLTHDAPIALLIDDLQWADPTSLEMLHYLASRLSDQSVLLLATYESDALNNSRRLKALVTSLKRNGMAEEIFVPRLEADAVDALARSILKGEAPSNLLARLNARAGGVPLFVENLVIGLIDSGDLARAAHGWVLDAKGEATLPSSIRYLILDRLERLAASDRNILDLIAITGNSAPYSTLKAASDVEERTLLKALRRLRARGLIAERAQGADVVYIITDPMVQEVAYSEVPEIERRQARQIAINSLESFPERPQIEAGWTDSRASAMVWNDCKVAEAVTYDESFNHGLPWLLEQLGEAWERVGEGEPAVAAWNEALAEREQTGDAVSMSHLHRRLALVEWDRGNFEAANAHLRASSAPAVGLSPKDHDVEDVQLLRRSLPNRLWDTADPSEMVEELLSVAKQVASPRSEAEANLVASIFSLEQGDVVAARKRASRALEIGESFSGGQGVAICNRAHGTLVLTGMRIGDHKYIRYHAERGLAMALRPDAPPMEVVPRVRMALAAFMAGSWDEALWLSMEAITAGRRIGHLRYLVDALAGRALILAVHGELPEAEACIAEVRMVLGSGLPKDRLVFSLVDLAESALALERGQAERALGIARGFTRPPTSWEAAHAGVTAASKPMALMLLAEAQVAVGDPKSALATAGEISRLRPTDTPYLVALTSRAEGLALQALGQRVQASDCLARAHEAFNNMEMPFEAARAMLEQATAMALAQPAAAATLAHSSLPIFDRLGAQRYGDRARRLLRSLGILPPPARRLRISGGPLSTRELQVARLVAEGLTTADIAQRLVLSPRTVTTHLDRIYARLGISSRTALVRYVTEAGLLSPEDDNRQPADS